MQSRTFFKKSSSILGYAYLVILERSSLRGAASDSPPKIFSRPISKSVFLGTTFTGGAGGATCLGATGATGATVAVGVKDGAELT
jgi:hypothetical protein